MLCEYGCGQEAKYFLKRAKKWCCSKSYNSCPYARQNNRQKHLGENNHRYGKVCSEETKNKIGQANKGNIPWNKNKIGVYTEETLKAMSEARKGKIPWNKGIKKEKVKIKKTDKRKLRKLTNEQNPNWKGGYAKNGFARFDYYAKKLTIDEDPKRDELDRNILTVVCYNCKKRFIPELKAVGERLRCLNGSQSGECRLYCSDQCKKSCSVFNKKIYQDHHPSKKEFSYTQEEYQTFRTYVLERDKYKCQYCGTIANYVHHERPQKLEPFFTLDPDLAWSVCKDCHYKYGHRDECSTGKLANKAC